MFVSNLSGFSHSFWGNHRHCRLSALKSVFWAKIVVLDGKAALLNKITSTVLEKSLTGSAAFIEKVALSHKGI